MSYLAPAPASTLSSGDHARFWDVVVPAFGLDESFLYGDADIAQYLADYDAGRAWHLFLISDGSSRPVLVSVEADTADTAEKLAIARALESWTLTDEFLGAEYVGQIDRDVNKRLG